MKQSLKCSEGIYAIYSVNILPVLAVVVGSASVMNVDVVASVVVLLIVVDDVEVVVSGP